MPRRPKFRKRRLVLLRWSFRFILLAGLLWAAGFVWFVADAWLAAPPDPAPHADGIVALTGGDGRVATALALLAAKDAPALLISGAGPGTYLGDFTADDAAAATHFAGAITLGHDAATTRGNAVETAEWARTRHLNSLLVVTADYHMRRAILVIRQRLPGVALDQYPVRPPAMDNLFSRSTLRLLAAEYSKYLVVRAGLDDIAEDDLGISS